MAKNTQDIRKQSGEINYSQILKDYPWIAKKNQKCILSPDSDGLLCGLFMSHYLNWEIIGFYDGKVCLLKDGFSAFDDNVCFLDIEIFRTGVKSMGHHMLAIYNSEINEKWKSNFKDCIQPNLMRGYDKNNFSGILERYIYKILEKDPNLFDFLLHLSVSLREYLNDIQPGI